MKQTIQFATAFLCMTAICSSTLAQPTQPTNAEQWQTLAAEFAVASQSTAELLVDGIAFWRPASRVATPTVKRDPAPEPVVAAATATPVRTTAEATPFIEPAVRSALVEPATRVEPVVNAPALLEEVNLVAGTVRESELVEPTMMELSHAIQDDENDDDLSIFSADDEPRSSQRDEYERIYSGDRQPRRIDNLFLDLTAGALNEPQSGATAFGSIGFNLGLPLADNGLGVQVGGDLTTVEGGDFMWDGTAGLYGRGIELDEDVFAGGAILGDYRHTVDGSDLFSLRWIAGVSTTDGHNVGVRGAYPLNQGTLFRSAAGKAEEEITLRHDIFYGHDFDPELSAEVWVGYQSGEVDSTTFGATVSWALAPDLAFAPMGEINTDGDYAVGASFVFDFGASGRSSTTTHFDRRGSNDFTPFRKRSFPLMLVAKEGPTPRQAAAAQPGGGGPGGGGPGGGGPGGGGPGTDPETPPKECDCFSITGGVDEFLRRR